MTTVGPILSTDVLWLLSNPLGSSGYTGSTVPGASLGGYLSTTQIVTNTLDNVFQDITGVQNAGMVSFYQCVFMMNNTETGLEMLTPYIWLPTSLFTSGGADIAVAKDPTGVTPYEADYQQALLIANNQTAPAGVNTWVGPTSSFTDGLLVENVPAQSVCPLWVRLTATNSAAVSPDAASIECAFNSAIAE